MSPFLFMPLAILFAFLGVAQIKSTYNESAKWYTITTFAVGVCFMVSSFVLALGHLAQATK